MARRFAAAGHRVAINARHLAGLEAVADEISRAGGTAACVPGDVCDPADIETVVSDTARQLGGIDVLVNNAVVRRHAPVEATTLEDWHAVLDVVLTGAFLCTKAVLPHMRRNGWGRIISMGGLAGQAGAPGRAAISAAKSGLFGMTRAIALETAGQGITVNVVSPGIIDTDRADVAGIGEETAVRRHYAEEIAAIPVGRAGRLSEVSTVCQFLASEEAAFITGQVIGVNGGRYL